MVKRPTGSDGEPSSPNRGASAGVKARHLLLLKPNEDAGFKLLAASRAQLIKHHG